MKKKIIILLKIIVDIFTIGFGVATLIGTGFGMGRSMRWNFIVVSSLIIILGLSFRNWDWLTHQWRYVKKYNFSQTIKNELGTTSRILWTFGELFLIVIGLLLWDEGYRTQEKIWFFTITSHFVTICFIIFGLLIRSWRKRYLYNSKISQKKQFNLSLLTIGLILLIVYPIYRYNTLMVNSAKRGRIAYKTLEKDLELTEEESNEMIKTLRQEIQYENNRRLLEEKLNPNIKTLETINSPAGMVFGSCGSSIGHVETLYFCNDSTVQCSWNGIYSDADIIGSEWMTGEIYGTWYMKDSNLHIIWKKLVGSRSVGREMGIEYKGFETENIYGITEERYSTIENYSGYFKDLIDIVPCVIQLNESQVYSWQRFKEQLINNKGEYYPDDRYPRSTLDMPGELWNNRTIGKSKTTYFFVRYTTRVKCESKDIPSGKYPFTSMKRLGKEELLTYNKDELRIMRNEIFARYGYVFKDTGLNAYFEKQNWYSPRRNTKYEVKVYLTPIEKDNIKMISKIESKTP